MRAPSQEIGNDVAPGSLVSDGDHACLLSADPGLRARVVARYLREGLGRGERVVCAAADGGRVVEALRACGVDVRAEAARGALRVRDARAVYGRGQGFEPGAMRAQVTAAVERARGDGFLGLRLCGESPRPIDDALMPSVLEHEAALDRELCAGGATALCVYDSAGWPSPRAAGVLQAHPVVMAAEAGARQNTLYRPRHAARVLVVDNHADGGESLSLLLAMLGHQCRVVSDGATALESARAWPPDVIVADLRLPGLDGYELARAVRGDGLLRETALIALTGLARDSDRQAAMLAGFDLHLVKPASPERLRAVLARPELLRPWAAPTS